MFKNQREQITDFVQGATQDELIDVVQSLLHGCRAGIAGMKGEAWLSGTGKPRSKKEAVESALRYSEIVNKEVSNKIFNRNA